jgi:fatty-acyl-CoA synthase
MPLGACRGTDGGAMLGLMMDYPLTIQTVLRRVAQFASHVEIVSRQADASTHRYTYGDMMQRAGRLARALRALGVRKGDRVATLAANHHRHLEAYFAVPAMSAVLHTLNVRLSAEELKYIAGEAGDRVVIVDQALWPLYQRSRIHAEHVIVITDDGDVPAGALDYERLLQDAGDEEAAYDDIPDERTAAAMCYTSGTTGAPKGIVYSHRAIVLGALQWLAADTVGIRQRDVILSVIPMAHINGWGMPFTAALAGAKLVLPGASLAPASLLSLVESERVTLSGGVPTVWARVLDALNEAPAGHDISSLQVLLIGGSAVPKGMVREYRERYGIRVIHAWGMTETTAVAIACRLPPHLESAPGEAQDEWLTHQGVPLPFVEIRARREGGLVPWDGETMGELEVRGATVAQSYYAAASQNGSFTADGWFRTGDIVTIDKHGCVLLRDRSKDLIKSGGEWISSVALENALMSHPSISEAAVIAVPHARWGERPLAVVVAKAADAISADELRTYLGAQFPKWTLPDAFEFVNEIQRSSTGKILKKALREQFRDRYERSPSGAATT